MADVSLYAQIGGEATVLALVTRFYDEMDRQPAAVAIRAMHQPDLSSARQKLFEFLSGWLGGPQLFVAKYGHPRLRARHLPFPIDPAASAAWMGCMVPAIEAEVPEALRAFLIEQLGRLAVFMENRA
jgi:hemoglobin